MDMTPLRLDQAMMTAAPVVLSDSPRKRVMRLRGTSPLVVDALADTELRFTLVPQPVRVLRLA